MDNHHDMSVKSNLVVALRHADRAHQDLIEGDEGKKTIARGLISRDIADLEQAINILDRLVSRVTS